jgi:hypothetical protein
MTSTTEQQPAIKWEIKKWADRILPVKVVKETDKTLWIERIGYSGKPSIDQRRKTNDFHDTWEAAHNELFRRANENVERQKRQLNRAQSELREIFKMRPPAPESQP